MVVKQSTDRKLKIASSSHRVYHVGNVMKDLLFCGLFMPWKLKQHSFTPIWSLINYNITHAVMHVCTLGVGGIGKYLIRVYKIKILRYN